MESALNPPIEELDREFEDKLNIYDGDSDSIEDFEDIDAYSEVFSEIDISEINPHIAIEDSDIPTISDASSFEIPEVTELAPEKIKLPDTQCKEDNRTNKWAHEVDPAEIIDDLESVIPNLNTKFEFELDNFQKQAIYYLELNRSIFVAAHTSSGKTVVAEYAAVMAMRNKTKMIYTSPIKALSNQSYRSFKHRFDNVGIITGDVQKNPDAPCVIMTTEILRDILYKGAESLNTVEFVVFDEVHYINDSERGVVWEEVIILLPAHIKLIMLTATVSNALEFAEWVGSIKNKPLYVIYTTKRPVPLEHYLYSSDKIYKVVDSDGRFLDSSWKEASDDLKKDSLNLMNKLMSNSSKVGRSAQQSNKPNAVNNYNSNQQERRLRRRDKKLRQLKSHLSTYQSQGASFQSNTNYGVVPFLRILKVLAKQKFIPAIVFTFSKMRCELYASKSKVDFNLSSKEKSLIHSFVSRALTRLDEADRNLPQILRVINFLQRGLAVHHGGLLPIVKEIVEIMFARGLVRVLFATETFAMGVNSPARCVVFSEIYKHDGNSFRDIMPGEYTQMSGRAGRRGMDTFGVAIVNTGQNLPQRSVIKNMMLGKPKKLESQFRLTYNMIMNLLRIESLNIHHMISRSFSEHTSLTVLSENIDTYDNQETSAGFPSCELCNEYELNSIFSLSNEMEKIQKFIIDNLILTDKIKMALSIGRIIIVNNGVYDNNIAIITSELYRDTLDSNLLYNKIDSTPVYQPPKFCFKALILADKSLLGSKESEVCVRPSGFLSIPNASQEAFITRDLSDSEVAIISNLRFPGFSKKQITKNKVYTARDFEASLLSAADSFRKEKRLSEIYTINKDPEYSSLVSFQMSIINSIFGSIAIKCPAFLEHYTTFSKDQNLKESVKTLHKYADTFSTQLHNEYSNRMDVLQRLGFVDSSDIVTLKGRIAIEIKRASPLILTEIILENVFSNCSPEEIAAVLSIFVYNQKKSFSESFNTTDNIILDKIISNVMEVVKKIAIIENECGVCDDVTEYMNQFNIEMATIAYDWVRRVPFLKIMETTTLMEGVIVRTMVHLEEVCREVLGAARCLGNNDLATKMESAVKFMRRDIAFSASLYF